MSEAAMELAVATASVDGRTFRSAVPPDLAVVAGDLVTISLDDGTDLLGQLLDVESARSGMVCRGTILGSRNPDGLETRGIVGAFSTGRLVAAEANAWEQLQASAKATMDVGSIRTMEEHAVPARLAPTGFNRHTLFCGQSGSGKTYALGVVLERLLVETALRIVIVDPNSDFVRLQEVRDDVSTADAEALQAVDVRILRATGDRDTALRSRFARMSPETKAAVLQLDPLADRDEYNALIHLPSEMTELEPTEIAARLRAGGPGEQVLGKRIENLGLLEWDLWARSNTSLTEVLDGGARVTVLDLSGFNRADEPLVAVLDLLEYLWAERDRKIPTLLVIDEAHTVCAAQPFDRVQRATTDRLVQIAGEGRKYGLWLLLSTQRPPKIHPNVLSQCDNLALMRMNSPGDLAELAAVFGFAPPAMLAMSPSFRQGEVLVAGGFVPAPAVIRVGPRRTPEGGSDVRVPIPAAV